jgi:hypothetical protein
MTWSDDEPTPLTLDVDRDGIDDRRELADLGIAGAFAGLAAHLRPPEPPAATRPRLARLEDILAELERTPTCAVPGWRARRVRDEAADTEYLEPSAAEIAEGAGLDVEVACLAACVASEAPRIDRYPQYGVAIARAVLNDCRSRRKPMTVYTRVTMDGIRLTGGRLAPATGHFARQRGRWCASLQQPTQRHVMLATLVLAGAGGDWRDARRWCDLGIMDRGMQAGRRLGGDAEWLIRRWYAGGLRWVGPIYRSDGQAWIDPYKLCLFADEGPDLDVALDMLADGRRRWRVSA